MSGKNMSPPPSWGRWTMTHKHFDHEHVLSSTIIHEAHHHHAPAGHVLYCPLDDCALRSDNTRGRVAALWFFKPADHDHGSTP